LLFFRMGDFYELFFEDAIEAAPVLEIALTRRGRHQGQDIPMCGVPAHNVEPYIQKLIRRGHKVAICEQLEDASEARKRPGKPLLRRDVVRIVTPGTLTEDGLLEARRHNHLLAIARVRDEWGSAWVDISTGELWTEPVDEAGLPALLARIEPGEVLLAERLAEDPRLLGLFGDRRERLTRLRDGAFDSSAAARRLAAFYGVADVAALGSHRPRPKARQAALPGVERRRSFGSGRSSPRGSLRDRPPGSASAPDCAGWPGPFAGGCAARSGADGRDGAARLFA